MRNILLLALFPIPATAQTVFAPIGAEWSYTQHYVGGPDTALFRIHCIGDTTIQGVNCSKLSWSGGFSACMGFFPFVTTAGDSVLFFDPADNTFRTLCVFGLPVGGTWRTIIGLGGQEGLHDTLLYTVTAADTIMLAGLPLRRTTVEVTYELGSYVHAPSDGQFIERFGNMDFLFQWFYGPCDNEINGPLRCYSDPEVSWLDPQYPQCELGAPGTVFAPIGARWVYEASWVSPPPFNDPHWMYPVYVTGDTVIAGRTCSIVHFPAGTDCMFPGMELDVYTHVSGDSVFRYDPNTGVSDLIMAFNAQPGDGWSVPVNTWDGQPFDTMNYLVASTDTLLVQGHALRRLNWTAHSQLGNVGVFTEGRSAERFGDMNYMFSWVICSDGTGMGPLLCYSDPEIQWPAPGVNCGTWLALPEVEHPHMHVSPTLVERGAPITVSTDAPPADRARVEVLDLLGRTVDRVPVMASATTVTVDNSGVFVIVLRTPDRPLARQRIVVR